MNLEDDLTDSFGPEQIDDLRAAFERSWQALSFRFAEGNSAEAHELREELARCIMEIAQGGGASDPVSLSNRALALLPPYASYWTNMIH